MNILVKIEAWWDSPRSRWLRFWWQRRTRGFDEEELWGLNSNIVDFLLPRLRAFREESPVVPISFLREAGWELDLTKEAKQGTRGFAEARWEETLDKMIGALEIYQERDGLLMDADGSQQKFDEGWKLFHEHFHQLWW